MADPNPETSAQPSLVDPSQYLPPRNEGFSLLLKIAGYHLVLAVFAISLALIFPNFIEQLPIGGINELAEGGDLKIFSVDETAPPDEDIQIVETFIRTTNKFDRLGYARQLTIVLVIVWLLMWPVSWVHKGIHKASAHDHSLDETTLVLPGIVASIVLVVQHSLALAFSLAGIVAGCAFQTGPAGYLRCVVYPGGCWYRPGCRCPIAGNRSRPDGVLLLRHALRLLPG